MSLSDGDNKPRDEKRPGPGDRLVNEFHKHALSPEELEESRQLTIRSLKRELALVQERLRQLENSQQ